MWCDLSPMFTSDDKEKISLTNTRDKDGVKTFLQNPNSIHLNSSFTNNKAQKNFLFLLPNCYIDHLQKNKEQGIKPNAQVAILDYVEQI